MTLAVLLLREASSTRSTGRTGGWDTEGSLSCLPGRRLAGTHLSDPLSVPSKADLNPVLGLSHPVPQHGALLLQVFDSRTFDWFLVILLQGARLAFYISGLQAFPM